MKRRRQKNLVTENVSADKSYRKKNKRKTQKEKSKPKGKEGKVQGKKTTEKDLRRRDFISPNMLPYGQGLCCLVCVSPTP